MNHTFEVTYHWPLPLLLGACQGCWSSATPRSASPGWTHRVGRQAYPRQTDPRDLTPFPLARTAFALGFNKSGLPCAGQISARVLANRGCWRRLSYHFLQASGIHKSTPGQRITRGTKSLATSPVQPGNRPVPSQEPRGGKHLLWFWNRPAGAGAGDLAISHFSMGILSRCLPSCPANPYP
jgi:hypothetical protein